MLVFQCPMARKISNNLRLTDRKNDHMFAILYSVACAVCKRFVYYTQIFGN